MNDETQKKINGWTVKAIIGGVGAAVGLALVMLATAGVGSTLTMIKETHDSVLVLKSKVEGIESTSGTAGAAAATVERRLMSYIDRSEAQIHKLEERVRAIEREHTNFKKKSS